MTKEYASQEEQIKVLKNVLIQIAHKKLDVESIRNGEPLSFPGGKTRPITRAMAYMLECYNLQNMAALAVEWLENGAPLE